MLIEEMFHFLFVDLHIEKDGIITNETPVQQDCPTLISTLCFSSISSNSRSLARSAAARSDESCRETSSNVAILSWGVSDEEKHWIPFTE